MEIPTPRSLLQNARARVGLNVPEKHTSPKQPASRAKKKISQAALQQEVQRFSAEFTDRILQTIEELRAATGETHSRVLDRRSLLYAAALLDIATGPSPEVAFLDLLTFFRLNRRALREYWIPEVFGNSAWGLEAAFAQSEDELLLFSKHMMTEKQRRALDDLTEKWMMDHPRQFRVEGTRFAEFTHAVVTHAVNTHAAEMAAGGDNDKASGLIGSVRAATSAADRALLLAERSVYLTQRMPFLLRLQLRLGAQETVDDITSQTMRALGDATSALARALASVLILSVGVFVFRWGKSMFLTGR
jgi:hypothetical protein